MRYRAVRYEPRPEIWQRVARVWDQVQTRPNQFHQYESDGLFPAMLTSSTRPKGNENERVMTVKPDKKPIRMPKIPERGEDRNIKFTRPTPGYEGYICRYPVEPKTPQGSWNEIISILRIHEEGICSQGTPQ